MNLIIETDLGHDPDDFFAICYLISAGVNIRAITVVPGDIDQLAIARLISKELDLNIPIGASKPSQKYSSGGAHYDVLDFYGHPREGYADGLGDEVIAQAMKEYPDSEFFIIGPCTSVGKYLQRPDAIVPKKLCMQGGFLGYHLYSPKERLSQFEGKTWMPTFNLNGDRKAAQVMLEKQIERRFVGKNVCHTLLFNNAIYESMGEVDEMSGTMFKVGAYNYLKRHREKKFHDPSAAVLMLHPEIGTWVRGRVSKIEGGWGTIPDENGDYVLADIDRDKFWDYIRTLT